MNLVEYYFHLILSENRRVVGDVRKKGCCTVDLRGIRLLNQDPMGSFAALIR
jgi:hypothetical protein